jgi:serine phosphatase RsbU (regulator of sigma subunit)
MNEALFGRLAGQYVTASYLFIDSRSGVIRYAAAGHPPMFRLIRRNLEVGEIEKNGLALGFFEASTYEEVEHSLEAGDRLLLYTDGMIEAENAGSALIVRQTSKPSISGIMTSSRIKSGRVRRAMSRARAPSFAARGR